MPILRLLDMPKYKYKPLDNDNEFRTLVISGTRKISGSSDEVLQCRLTTHPLPSKSPLRYDAISWNWGKYDEFKSIDIIGEDDQIHVLSVRPNLIKTLQGLRGKGETGRFWIDAVCIDQDNLHERDLQVQNMFEIYSSAASVCIWLGGHAHNSSMALDFIQHQVCDVAVFATVTEGYTEEWKALAALMNRDWFSRKWGQ